MDTLYISPGTAALAVALAAEEMGIPLAYARVNFKEGDQTKPDYLAINPKGRVPALATSDGVLTEAGAILDYLATQAPGFVPEDAFQAGKMREIMYYLASTAHVNHAHKMRGHRWADQEASWADMTAKVPETIARTAAYLEEAIVGPFALGEALTLADPYLFTVLRWFPGDGVPLDGYPKLKSFFDAYAARASVAKMDAEGLL